MTKHRALWVGLATAALGLPALSAGFLFADDLSAIAGIVLTLRQGWGHILDRVYGSPIRPVLTACIMVDYMAWGTGAAGWRAAVLVLEGLSAAGFAWLVARAGARPAWACGAALLWAVAPGRVEPSVLQATQKGLGLLWTVAAAAAGWRWTETGRARWLALTSACCGLGAFTYPIGLLVPLALVPAAAGRPRRLLAWAVVPWIILWFAAEVVWTALLGEARIPSSLDAGWWGPAAYAKNFVGAVSRALLPFSVSLDMSEATWRSQWWLEAGLKLAACSALVAAGVRAWRMGPGGRFWVGWLGGAAAFPAARWVVDSRHLPLIAMGACGLLAHVASGLSPRARRAVVAAAVLIEAGGVAANARALAGARSASAIVAQTIGTLVALPPEVRSVTIQDLPCTGTPPGAIIYHQDDQIGLALALFRPGPVRMRVLTITGPTPRRPAPDARYRYVAGRLERLR